ncbi:hypothetical protein E4U21_006177 [Claviceps maximensis]|nr:hypothetical protein E4U21_006177 [Claviceps maximensis]
MEARRLHRSLNADEGRSGRANSILDMEQTGLDMDWQHGLAAFEGSFKRLGSIHGSKRGGNESNAETAKPQAGAHSPSLPRQLAAHVFSQDASPRLQTATTVLARCCPRTPAFPQSRIPRSPGAREPTTASRPFAADGTDTQGLGGTRDAGRRTQDANEVAWSDFAAPATCHLWLGK